MIGRTTRGGGRALRPHRNAVVLIYVSVMLVAMLGFISFTVDYGRVQLAKFELQRAADAAARYAAAGLSDNSWQSKAIAAAADNTVDDTALVLQAGDITRVNVAADGSYTTVAPFNGVRVMAQRTAARSTAVQLHFAKFVGRSTCDIHATSIAKISSPNYDIVALTSITLANTAQIKRIASESGTVRVATNGSCSVPAGTFIYGDIYHRGTAPSEPAGGITGSDITMSQDVTFAPIPPPGSATMLGVVNVTSGTFTVPGGTYVATSITMSNAIVNITGDAAIYSNGPVSLTNCTINTSGTTNKITFFVTTNDTITYNMTSPFYVLLYAPASTLNMVGSSQLVGSCVVKNLSLSGTSSISYSSALPLPTASVSSISTTK